MTAEAPPPKPDKVGLNTSLHIDVEIYAGPHIPIAIKEMVELANRLQIDVWAKMNGIRTLAQPGDDPEKIYAAWDYALQNKREYARA